MLDAGDVKCRVAHKHHCNVWAPSQNCEKQLLASSCLSFRMEQLDSHWTYFHYILYLSTFRKFVEKIKFLKKNPTKITGTLHEKQYTFLIISRSFLLRMKNISDTSCRDNRKTQSCSVTLF
jgi:hypothetical protein